MHADIALCHWLVYRRFLSSIFLRLFFSHVRRNVDTLPANVIKGQASHVNHYQHTHNSLCFFDATGWKWCAQSCTGQWICLQEKPENNLWLFYVRFELFAKLPFFVMAKTKRRKDQPPPSTTNGNLFFYSNNCFRWKGRTKKKEKRWRTRKKLREYFSMVWNGEWHLK